MYNNFEEMSRGIYHDSKSLQGIVTVRENYMPNCLVDEKWKNEKPPPIPPKTYKSEQNRLKMNCTENEFYKGELTYTDEYVQVVPLKRAKLSQTSDAPYLYQYNATRYGESIKEYERQKVC